VIFGSRSRFAIDVDRILNDTGSSRRVDVCAAGRWLTTVDNSVYVPHFAGCLERTVGFLLTAPQDLRFQRPYPNLSIADNYCRLRADRAADKNDDFLVYRFMDWGPTADNLSALLFLEGDTAFIPFSFVWESERDPVELGKVFVAELPVWELATVLHKASWALMWDWADRSKWGPNTAANTITP
jgi:hypothetical protein